MKSSLLQARGKVPSLKGDKMQPVIAVYVVRQPRAF